jgi:hypothetical protein
MPIVENVVRKKPVLAGRPVRATPTQREAAEVAVALAAIGEADDPRLMEMAQDAGADVDEDAAVAMAAGLGARPADAMPNQAMMERRRGPARR